MFSNKCFSLQLPNTEHRSTGNHQERSEISVPYKSDDQFIRRWLSTLSEYRKSISHCLRWACCLSGQYKNLFFSFWISEHLYFTSWATQLCLGFLLSALSLCFSVSMSLFLFLPSISPLYLSISPTYLFSISPLYLSISPIYLSIYPVSRLLQNAWKNKLNYKYRYSIKM